MNGESRHDNLIPGYVVALAAIICAVVLILMAILGPLGIGVIHYRTSQSNLWQTEGQDLADLLLVTPILLIGSALLIAGKSSSKYFLILPPITLMYTGLSYGIGQEWNNPAYAGNVENYFWLFLTLIIGGLILLAGSLSMFTEEDAPNFKPKGLRIYVGLMAIFLLLFAAMWASELFEVIATGNTSTGSYQAAPTGWWVIRYLDLGISIPLGFLAIFLFLSRPRKAYPMILLFFGFFITMGTAVNTMAIVQVMNKDPSIAGAAASGLVIFPVIGVLTYAGLFYLVKDKLLSITKKRSG
jgi:hypothetical protein